MSGFLISGQVGVKHLQMDFQQQLLVVVVHAGTFCVFSNKTSNLCKISGYWDVHGS